MKCKPQRNVANQSRSLCLMWTNNSFHAWTCSVVTVQVVRSEEGNDDDEVMPLSVTVCLCVHERFTRVSVCVCVYMYLFTQTKTGKLRVSSFPDRFPHYAYEAYWSSWKLKQHPERHISQPNTFTFRQIKTKMYQNSKCFISGWSKKEMKTK